MLLYQRYRKLIYLTLVLTLLAGCQSANFPALDQMLIRFTTQFPGIYRLVSAVAYLTGMILIFRAVYQLKVYGDMRTMMSAQTNLKSTLVLFIAGTALMYTPTALKIFMYSTFGTTNITDPMAYASGSSGDTAVRAVLMVVQLIGIISFIRGWILLTQSQSGGGHSTFGKAVTHIIAGIFAVNIVGVRNLLQGTFGIT